MRHDGNASEVDPSPVEGNCAFTRMTLGRQLPHTRQLSLVLPQSFEGRRPSVNGLRPFRELELAHQPRLDEVRPLRRPADVEGRALALKSGHQKAASTAVTVADGSQVTVR